MGDLLCSVSLLLLNAVVWISAAEHGVLSCGEVPEVLDKRVGWTSSGHGHLSPVTGATLSECSSTLQHTGGLSCCTADLEAVFLPASEDYLQDHIRVNNGKLLQRITLSLHLFQKYLRQSVHEEHNKTSNTLTHLYKIPHNVHTNVLSRFFNQLASYLLGNDELTLMQIVETFFRHLFPVVFNYVLSDPSVTKRHNDVFEKCLIKSYDVIQPFGSTPKHLERNLKYRLEMVQGFTETLELMRSSLEVIGNFTVPLDCRKAISRMHFCSLCSGQAERRPCRGICLNVMRGCLSGVAEISTSWDDLVAEFQRFHLAVIWGHSAHELLSSFDGNLTDVLLAAMEDGPKIFARVISLCQDEKLPPTDGVLNKKLPSPDRMIDSHQSARVHVIRKDIAELLVQLEESKGFPLRIADSLCRVSSIYDQEMQSETCWNGSAVGRYMREVPEANVISQAKHNAEVKVMLIPDPLLLQVKDTLVHMKRNLTALHNQGEMQNDQSYKAVVGSGGGYGTGRDVINDDEDFSERNSGSGSGYGDDDEDDDVGDGHRNHGDKPTYTSRPMGGDNTGRGQGSFTPSSGGSGGSGRSGDGRDKNHRGGRNNRATTPTSVSIVILCICNILSRAKL